MTSRSPVDYEDLPFPAGTSPFRIKGTAYIGHLDYAETQIPGGQAAIVAELRDPKLRDFFRQQFLASSWYDILPMLPLGAATARLVGMPLDDFLRYRTRLQAERDVRGVYKMLLQFVSVEALALRIPRIASTYYDFGTADSSVVAPGHVESRRTGVPEFILPWHNPVTETFMERVISLGGGKSPSVKVTGVERDGTAHGVRLAAVTFTCRWRVRGEAAPDSSPDSRSKAPDSRVPDSRSKAPDSRAGVPDSRKKPPDSR